MPKHLTDSHKKVATSYSLHYQVLQWNLKICVYILLEYLLQDLYINYRMVLINGSFKLILVRQGDCQNNSNLKKFVKKFFLF